MILVVAQDTVGAVGEMSAAQASLYGGLGGGLIGGMFALIGVLGGLLLERKLRSWGEIRCSLGYYNHYHQTRSGNIKAAPANWRELRGEELENIAGVHQLRIRFFNDKDEATGLADITVVFVGKDGREVVPRRAMRNPDFPATSDERGGMLDLPPGTWVTMEFAGFVYGEDALLADSGWERIEVRGKLPSGKVRKFVVRKQ
jgi:hypothetical protein